MFPSLTEGDKKNTGYSKEELDALGSILLQKINIDSGYCEYPLLEETDYDKLDNTKKLELIYLITQNKNYSNNDNEKCMALYEQYYKNNTDTTGFTGIYDNACLETSIDKDIYTNTYYNLFGYGKTINEENFFSANCQNCRFENGDLKCYQAEGCGGMCGEIPSFNYKSSRQENDSIIVTFEKYLEEDGKKEFQNNYEATFKQDSIGNWYWTKTSIVK